MSDSTKIFSLPSETSGSGLLNVIAPLLQQRGLDPNMVFAMMNNGNRNGFTDGGMFWWVIFLFFLMGWGGNGWGGFGGNSANGIPNQINNDYGRSLLLDAINRNGTDISALASNLNCSVGQVQNAINQVQSLIQGVSNQVGMSGQQVINAIQSCCCDMRAEIAAFKGSTDLQICQQTNTLGNAINTVNSSVERGFASAEYNTQAQTCALTNAIEAQSRLITDKFAQLEQRELTRENQNLRDQLAQCNLRESQTAQNAYLLNRLQPTPVPAYPVGANYGLGWGNYYGYNNGCNSCGCGI